MNNRPTREERESWIAGGRASALADDDRAELALLADLLAHPSTWAEPNAGLEDSVVQAVLAAAPASAAPGPHNGAAPAARPGAPPQMRRGLATALSATAVLASLASLVLLLITAFWAIDPFTTKIVQVWNLDNFQTIVTDDTYRIIVGRTVILAALVTVYIVLGVLYESYIHPITILSTLPSAGVGAILALLICRTDFSIISLIGIILLIGIVKKNAIMMIDFALDAERRLGLAPADAIYQACIIRFRPIMMTTMAALLGSLPLALGLGTGAELRQPLGIAVVGGLMLSQTLTLFTTPVVYLTIEKLRLHVTAPRRVQRAPGNPTAGDEPAIMMT